MVHDKELLCGCIERRTNEGTTKLHECGRHKPLSFGGRVRNLCDPAFTPPKGYLAAAPSLEDTQPINGPSLVRGSGSTVAPKGYGEPSVPVDSIARAAQALLDAPDLNLDSLEDTTVERMQALRAALLGPRHTVCEFTPSQLNQLLLLVQAERVQLLQERRTYVFARKGDPHRFSDLLEQIDRQLAQINPIGDKLRLWVGRQELRS